MATSIKEKTDRQKVAIYIRVSTHWQVDKDSLQVQRRELIAYSEMILGINDFVVFEDPGYSAKNTERPDYKRMMERLRTGEFSHLLVWKIDRISRNLLDFTTMYQELKKLGVTFVSKNEKFDTSSAIGEAMLKIILVFAELERNMTSERVTAVMLSRATNGQWNGGRPPYGYAWDKKTKTFSLVAEEQQIVHRIYNMYEQYQSTLYIAKYLNEAEVPTRSGKHWNPAGVHKILTNKFYLGVYEYNKTNESTKTKNSESEWIVIPDHHPASISTVQYDRVQLALQRNKRGSYKRGETKLRDNIHIFAGIVKCGVCGSNMTATPDRIRADGWKPSIYGCRKHRSDLNLCSNKYVSDVTLGPFVFNYVANIIRAKESTKSTTKIINFEKKLLKGKAFENVKGIERDGLKALYSLIINGSTGLEYKPSIVFKESGHSANELEILEERRRKKVNALNRLRALYLYGDEETPEKDYILERKRMIDEITEIDKRLDVLRAEQTGNETVGDEFIEKASYFVMVQKLLGNTYIDYPKYIKSIDPAIPANFIKTIIDKITVTDGKIMSIEFSNGIVHNFIY